MRIQVGKSAIVAVSMATGAMLLGGVTYAATATSSNVVACAAKKGGALRLAVGGKCKKKEKKVSWAVAGPKGAKGATGAAGAPGANGATGPSNGYLSRPPAGTLPYALRDANGASQGFTTVRTLSLPAGSYVLAANATVNLNNAGGTSTGCRIAAGAENLQTDAVSGPSANTAYRFNLIDAVTVNVPTDVKLQCVAPDGGMGTTAGADNLRLSAVKVGTLTITP